MKLVFAVFSFFMGIAVAQDSICVKYTKAVFGDDTAANELALVTAVVNRAVLGDTNSSIPGILADEGGLAPFFTGAGPTTNRGGDTGVAVNFLDGAGDLPALTGNTGILLDHLYQFFGALLGCAAAGFPAYTGDPDMLRVHKFMSITQEMNDFFITQVGLSASSFGVTDDDVMAIASVLDSTFNTRCPPPVMAGDGLPAFLVGTNPSICQDPSCPLDEDGPCLNSEIPTKAPSMTPTMAPTSGSMVLFAMQSVVLAFGAAVCLLG